MLGLSTISEFMKNVHEPINSQRAPVSCQILPVVLFTGGI